MKRKVFNTWKNKGITFLALERPSGFVIVDDEGNAYGTWHTLSTFKRRQKKQCESTTPIGKMEELKMHFRFFASAFK